MAPSKWLENGLILIIMAVVITILGWSSTTGIAFAWLVVTITHLEDIGRLKLSNGWLTGVSLALLELLAAGLWCWPGPFVWGLVVGLLTIAATSQITGLFKNDEGILWLGAVCLTAIILIVRFWGWGIPAGCLTTVAALAVWLNFFQPQNYTAQAMPRDMSAALFLANFVALQILAAGLWIWGWQFFIGLWLGPVALAAFVAYDWISSWGDDDKSEDDEDEDEDDEEDEACATT